MSSSPDARQSPAGPDGSRARHLVRFCPIYTEQTGIAFNCNRNALGDSAGKVGTLSTCEKIVDSRAILAQMQGILAFPNDRNGLASRGSDNRNKNCKTNERIYGHKGTPLVVVLAGSSSTELVAGTA